MARPIRCLQDLPATPRSTSSKSSRTLGKFLLVALLVLSSFTVAVAGAVIPPVPGAPHAAAASPPTSGTLPTALPLASPSSDSPVASTTSSPAILDPATGPYPPSTVTGPGAVVGSGGSHDPTTLPSSNPAHTAPSPTVFSSAPIAGAPQGPASEAARAPHLVASAPTLTISPSGDSPSATVTLDGSNFADNSLITVTWTGSAAQVCSTATNSGGSWSCPWIVPTGTPVGVYNVSAVDGDLNSAWTLFRVTSVTANPSFAEIGDTVAVSGSGYAPSVSYSMSYNGPNGGSTICSGTTNATGAVSCLAVIPGWTSTGIADFSVSDGSGDTGVSAPLHILSFSSSPPGTSQGASVTFSGAGFVGISNLDINWTHGVACSTVTVSGGSFSCPWGLPAFLANGLYNFSAEDANGDTAFLWLRVSSLTSSLPGASIGQEVTVNASGLDPFATYSVTLNAPNGGGSFCSGFVNATGGFVCSETIPTWVGFGAASFSVQDGAGDVATTPSFRLIDFTTSVPGVSAGETSTFTGTAFTPTSTVTVSWSGGTVCITTTSSSGGFSCSLTVPGGTSVGSHPVTATDSAGLSATFPFHVTSVVLSNAGGAVGANVTITGAGYVPSETFSATFNAPNGGGGACSGIVNASGVAVCSATVPGWAAVGGGSVSVADSRGDTGAASFRYVSFTTSDPGLQAGSVATFSGSGFTPLARVNLTWSWAPGVLCTQTTDGTGAFSCSFTVPLGTPVGSYTVTVTDSAFVRATFLFYVTYLSVQPDGGLLLNYSEVNGSGFAPGEAFTASLHASNGGGNLCSGYVNASGDFACTFQIPSWPAIGAASVSVSDSRGDYGSVVFYLVTLTPNSGNEGLQVGATATFNGDDFTPVSPVIMTWGGLAAAPCLTTTNGAGDFSCSLTVPAGSAPGAYVFTATDGNHVQAQYLFHVTWMSISVVGASQGEPENVSAAGFQIGSVVNVILNAANGGGTVCTGVVNASGTYSCSFFFPGWPATGADSIEVQDGRGDVASLPGRFLTLSASPSSATAGSGTSFSGGGYAGTVTVTVTWEYGVVCTTTTSSGGALGACGFTIPGATAPGTYLFVATDGSGDRAVTTFTVLPSPKLTLSPTFGEAGSAAPAASGSGFPASTPFTVTWSGSGATVCSGTTTGTGTFSCSAFTIPGGTPPGIYTFTATASTFSAQATFQVTSGSSLPTLTVSVPGSPSLTVLTLTGANFVPGGAGLAQVTWTGTPTTACSNVAIGSAGGFACSFSVPAGEPVGLYTFTATDNVGNVATVTFRVTKMVENVTGGPGGTLVNLTAWGYASNTSYTLTFDDPASGSQTVCSYETSANGSVDCHYTVPSWSADSSTFTLTDADGNTATLAYRLTQLTISPVGSPAGTQVTLSGSSFAANSPITVTWTGGPGSLCTGSSTNAQGAFSCSYTVPSATPVGAYMFVATDNQGDKTTISYLVTLLVANLTGGYLGTLVTLTASGFTPLDEITFSFHDPGTGTITTCAGYTSTLGRYTCYAQIPTSGWASDASTFTATDGTGATATASFLVTSLSLNQAGGLPKTALTLTGADFEYPGTAGITWTGPGAGSICTGVPVIVGGGFTCSFVIPASTPVGVYLFIATDGQGDRAVVPFRVVSFSANVTGSFPGIPLSFSATGFVPDDTFTLSGDNPSSGSYTACTGVVALDGIVSCSSFVPSDWADVASTYTLTDAYGDTATISFLVTGLTISVPGDLAGTTVTLSASDLTPSSAYTLTWSGGLGNLCSGTTNPSGGFTCSTTIPGATPVGIVKYTATDAAGLTAYLLFRVLALIENVSGGGPGEAVTVSGFGYAPSTAFTLGFDDPSSGSSNACVGFTSASGSFACLWTIPNWAPSASTFTATDGNGDTATITFLLAQLSVSVPGDQPGTTLTFTGSTFSHSVAISVRWGSTSFCTSTHTNTAGGFTCVYTIPAGTPVGQYLFIATDADGVVATTTFRVTQLAVNLTGDMDGSYVTVTGWGFAPLTGYTVSFSNPDTNPTICTGYVQPTGFLRCFWPISSSASAAGSSFHAQDTPGDVATVTFLVTALADNPSLGLAGSHTTFTGTDFAAGTQVDVTWQAGTVTACTATVNVGGGFSCIYEVPTGTLDGAYLFTATDAQGDTASTVFTVGGPSLGASPSSVPVGGTVTFTGHSFTTGQTVTVTWLSGSFACSGSTGSTTTFSCTFVIPTGTSAGPYTFTATDPASDSATTTVTVLPTPAASTPVPSVPSLDLGRGSVIFSTIASGGSGTYPTYTWSESSPNLGCTLANAPSISCTPLATGAFTVSVTVTDSNSVTSPLATSASFSVYLGPSVSVPGPSVWGADIGQSVVFAAVGVGGTGSYVQYNWTESAGGLGCAITHAASITCVPSGGAASYTVSVTVEDSDGDTSAPQTSAPFLVFLDPSVAVPTGSPGTGGVDVGQAVTLTTAAAGGSGGDVVTWFGLPGCASANLTSWSCATSASGTFSITVRVVDSVGFSATSSPLAFVVDTLPTATVPGPSASSVDLGQTATFSTTASGGSGGYLYTWTQSSANLGCVTGTSGSSSTLCDPTVAAAGYTVSVKVVDANGGSTSTLVSAPFTVYADPQTSVPTPSPASVDQGQTVHFSTTASLGTGSYPTYAWSETGTGLGCTLANAATITCVTTAFGTYTVSVTVTDSNGVSTSSETSGSYTVNSEPAVSAPTPSLASVDVGQSVVFSTVASHGTGTYSSYLWSASSPALGCTLVSAASITCVPTGAGTTYTVSVTVTDSDGATSASATSASYTVFVDPSASTPSPSVANVDLGQTVSFAVTAAGGSGGYVYTWSESSANLGCTVGASPSSSTVCVPTVAGASYTVSVKVADSNGATTGTATSATYTVHADPLVGVPTPSPSTVDVGQTVVFATVATLGTGTYPSYVWTESGAGLGCTLANAASISCVAASTGSYTVSVTATDSNGVSSPTATSTSFVVSSDPAVSLPTPSPASVDVGQTVVFSTVASGGSGTYTAYGWSASSSALGCTLASSASISCVPTAAGTTYTVSVTVSDSNGFTSPSMTSAAFTVDVGPSISAPAPSVTSVDLGQTVTFSATASAGSGGYVYTWSESSATLGCAVGSSSSPSTLCDPTVAGSGYTVSVKVVDSNGASSSTVTSASFTVYADPVASLPTPAPAGADVGQTITFSTVATLGTGTYPTYAWSASGVGFGCTIANSASISCVPTAFGSYTVSVTVTDSNHATSSTATSASFSVASDPTVSAPVASTPSVDVGQTVVFTTAASGGSGTYSAYTWSASNAALGCTLASTTSISCVPTGAGTTYTVSVSVTDSNGFTSAAVASAAFTVDLDPSASAPAPSVASVDVGQTVVFSTVASAGSGTFTTYTWSPSGSGLGCATSTTASVSCTATTAGNTYTVSVTVTDSNGATSAVATSASFTAYTDPTVGAPTPSVASLDVGQAVVFTAAASGGSGGWSYAWTVSSSGLGCAVDTQASIDCTPSAASALYSVSVAVSDSNGWTSTESAGTPYTVYAALAVTTPTVSPSEIDLGATLQVTTTVSGGSGGVAFTWSGLPAGCTASAATFTCVPTAVGGASLSVRVVDSNGGSATSHPANLTVNPALTGTAQSNTTSTTVGGLVSFSASSSGGTAPVTYTWRFGDGSSSTSQDIAHPFAAVGSYTVSLWVNDSAGSSVVKTLVISVVAPSSASKGSAATGSPFGWLGLWFILILGLVVLALVIIALRQRKVGQEGKGPQEGPTEGGEGAPKAPPVGTGEGADEGGAKSSALSRRK